ncbi:MAG: flagellin [Phycisphaeraceae bacterium]|nr:flagellin [Phycisphaerales bacterium]QOJ17805.1 MAG: flagellin [Phycisphaeraceae bacterium]
MARINTNVSSMIAQSNLARSNQDLTVRLQRLSTGLRINRGADDPAGLIASERLRAEARGIGQAIRNSERASSVIATTEGALAEVADLLNSIKGLIVEASNSGGLSREEIEANQLQIDSAIESITRISNTASFAGLQLLNGSLGYQTSVLPATEIAGARIHSAAFNGNPTVPVSVEVISSAQTAQLFLSGNTAGAPGALLSSVTIEIAGNLGVTSLSFVSGTALSAVVAAVNAVKSATGVSATLVDPADQTSGLVFNSTNYGSDQFVSVRKLGSGGEFFAVADAPGGNIVNRDAGRDVAAIVNGSLARGKGLTVSTNTPTLAVELVLTRTFAQTLNTPASFDITGGGATFQIGQAVTPTQQVHLGIASIAASQLGGTMIGDVRHFLDSLKTGGVNSLVAGSFENASKILDSAISEVAVTRGRLGAIERNTIDTTIRSLQVGLENITSSESKIRDADFAAETANLTRSQILVQAGTSILATANTTSQNVLALLQ